MRRRPRINTLDEMIYSPVFGYEGRVERLVWLVRGLRLLVYEGHDRIRVVASRLASDA